jgi:hypothetical protein
MGFNGFIFKKVVYTYCARIKESRYKTPQPGRHERTVYSFITTPRFSKNIEVRCDFQDYVSLISKQH